MKALLVALLGVVIAQSAAGYDFSDVKQRLEVSDRIRTKYGIGFDPLSASLAQLLELEARIDIVARIRSHHGVSFDYARTSQSTLLELESKLDVCKRLKAAGLAVDYRLYSLQSLLAFEARASGRNPNPDPLAGYDWQVENGLLRNGNGDAVASRSSTAHSFHQSSRFDSGLSPTLATSRAVTSPRSSEIYHSTTTPSRAYSAPGVRYYDPTYRPPVGDHYVRGYTRSDGTYVAGHYKTNPDDSFWNNYSSYGNVNPYTGRSGYKLPPISSYSGRSGYRLPSISTYSGGSSYVRGYTRRDGTYVSPHYRRR